MLGHLRLALADDRLAQARNAESRDERGAEAYVFDKSQRALLTADAAGGDAAKVMIAMTLQRVEKRAVTRQRIGPLHRSALSTHSRKISR